MLYLLSGIIALGIITALIRYFGNRKRKNADDNDIIHNKTTHDEATNTPAPPIDSECCGQHEVCERDSLLIAAGQKIEYYEDEELDQYAGVASDAHSAEAIQEFEDVLFTLRKEEVADWLRSLQLRHINLPDALKDEAILLLNEKMQGAKF